MRFVNPLPFVMDIHRSKDFYTDILALEIAQDHGNVVLFKNGFAIHEGASLYKSVFGRAQIVAEPYGRENLVLYFETDDIESSYDRIRRQADVIHPITRQAWGQRVFRLWDPDRHIIEVGEPQVPTKGSEPLD